MKKLVAIFLLLLLVADLPAQLNNGKRFPLRGVSFQYAGSVGFLSAGYHIRSRKEKLEISAVYGYTPEEFGGELHSASLKFMYNPVSIRFLDKLTWEPLQPGCFFAQNFGENLYLTWPEKYPRQYYWWPASLRTHVFLSTQLGYELKEKGFSRVSWYFEANTNDLYIASYGANRRALSLYDIVSFGMGLKADFR